MSLNIEIKARCADLSAVEKILIELHATYKGEDHQIDTFFHVRNGRLKLREGNIENALIQYHRENVPTPRPSNYQLYKAENLVEIKGLLAEALGTLIVVDKRRKIFYVQNAKIHLDTLEELGTFVEIEIIEKGSDNDPRFKNLHEQCRHYMNIFGIHDHDLCSISYSDMLMQRQS